MKHLLTLLLILALLLPAFPVAAQGIRGVTCIPRASEVTFGHFNGAAGTTMLDTAEIQAVVAWSGTDLWVGYPQGWARPLGAEVLVIYLSREGYAAGVVEVSYSIEYPDEYAVLAYLSREPFADANGEHWGKHPKCAFTMPRIVIDAWLRGVSGR